MNRPRLVTTRPDPAADQLRTLLSTLQFCAEAAERLKDNAAEWEGPAYVRTMALRASVAFGATIDDLTRHVTKGAP